MRITRHWVLFACLSLAGCGSTTTSEVTDLPGSTTELGSEQAEVSLAINSWTDTEKQIASYKGKIVVLDAWATW